MPEQFEGLVEILISGTEVTTISLDGDAADVDVGGGELHGTVRVHDMDGNERIWLDARDGRIIIRDAGGQEVIQLLGNDRDVLVRNAAGDQLFYLESSTATLHVGGPDDGHVRVYDAAGRETIHLNGQYAVVDVGTEGNEGDIRVFDGQGRNVFDFNGQYAWLRVGAENNEGDIEVIDSNGRRAFHVDGNAAFVRVGAEDNEGDIEVFDQEARSVFHFNGESAWLRVGAEDNEGDIEVIDSNGRRALHFNGQNAWMQIGAEDNDGDIAILNSDGDTTIHLDGESGDIILQNADTAEDFEVADEAAAPGMVMVLDDAGRLHRSTGAYDRRVAGVISGAGAYRPGIILGRTPDGGHKLPLALNGRVYCNVDATYGPIAVGDLLTTSQTPGHAMKAQDPMQAFGAVIGKALQSLEAGTGMIPILVALQ